MAIKPVLPYEQIVLSLWVDLDAVGVVGCRESRGSYRRVVLDPLGFDLCQGAAGLEDGAVLVIVTGAHLDLVGIARGQVIEDERVHACEGVDEALTWLLGGSSNRPNSLACWLGRTVLLTSGMGWSSGVGRDISGALKRILEGRIFGNFCRSAPDPALQS